jgi:hypothetical protein
LAGLILTTLPRYLPSRRDMTASYAVSVRRDGTLPAASLGFRLTTDTHAVRLTVYTTFDHTTVKQMTLTRHAPCLAHKRKRPDFSGRYVLLNTSLHCQLVPKTGIEPARGIPHKNLNLARLPIPPLRHIQFSNVRLFFQIALLFDRQH